MMKTLIKRELLNDLLTGLLVAATFAAVAPTGAFAALSDATQAADTSIMKPALHVVGIISYGLGAVMTVTGISACKKHADAPANNPLGPGIGKLAAGAAFLAAPTVIGMIQSTGTNTITGDASFREIQGF